MMLRFLTVILVILEGKLVYFTFASMHDEEFKMLNTPNIIIV